MSRNHAFVNSDTTQFDSNCAVCGRKDRDDVHRTTEERERMFANFFATMGASKELEGAK